MAVEWKLFPVFFLVLSHRSAVFSEDLDDDYIAFEPSSQHGLNVDSLQANNGTQSHSKRYLLYDVNPGEGFNLRRDVYMRVANMMKLLREKQNWVLVVPPWRKLYHWRSPIEQNALPWRTFFDLESLNRYVPVIEFEDFVKETGEPALDEILYLQGYAEGWKDGHWEEKIDDRDCIDRPVYHKDEDGLYRGYFWGMDDVFARKFKCLSVQGTAAILVPTLLEKTKSRLDYFNLNFLLTPFLEYITCWILRRIEVKLFILIAQRSKGLEMNSIPRVNLFVFHWYVMASLRKFPQGVEDNLKIGFKVNCSHLIRVHFVALLKLF